MPNKNSELELDHIHFSVDDDGIATARMDRAGEAMNTLGPDLAGDLVKVIERCETDPAIKALVLGSAKPDNFLAGADIRFLRDLTDATEAVDLLGEVHHAFARLEALTTELGKPVVAAIHGACLGGGMELALATSMRIASNDEKRTQLGQPEVQLGIIPGGGGTQRLPRLIGIAAGLDLILTGRSVRPRRALKMGLVDEICPKEVLLDTAHKRAREAVDSPDGDATRRGRRRSWLSPAALQQLALEENPVGRRVLFSRAEEKMLAATKGNYPAPPAALRAVKIGIEDGMEAGYAAELAEFGKLVVSPESKALMSVFFAGQALKKDRGIDSKAKPRTISKVGVLGGGHMGGGIAAVNTTNAKTPTRINEVDDAGVGRGLAYVRKVLDRQVKRRRMKPAEADRAMSLVTGTTDYRGYGDVDLVIEAVFEDLELKQSVLRKTEEVTGESTIFASNTSSIPITQIAAAAGRPKNVVGMHYFSPVEKMPLLEVIVTDRTYDAVTATVVEFGKQQGKTVIVVNDGTGFYTTRVLGPYLNEVGYLLAEGVAIEDIDSAMVAWGFPIGPVLLSDEVGIDVGAKIAKILEAEFGERMTPEAGFSALVDDDRKGRKNGRGFYEYEDGERQGVDASVYETLGVQPTTEMPRQEIQQRLVLPLINEAVRCLEEGILRSARDGDIGAFYGFGFPPFRGGPFWYVDQVGAKTVVAKLDEYAEQFGPRFEPAQLLRDAAADGRKFRT
jgi:3-hydroxyacyl-CoA dehydrogenase/enoyl-CoA hydratase/3-hydroxybutyryl-CoA epimerase